MGQVRASCANVVKQGTPENMVMFMILGTSGSIARSLRASLKQFRASCANVVERGTLKNMVHIFDERYIKKCYPRFESILASLVQVRASCANVVKRGTRQKRVQNWVP